jgi:hypothetical protein
MNKTHSFSGHVILRGLDSATPKRLAITAASKRPVDGVVEDIEVAQPFRTGAAGIAIHQWPGNYKRNFLLG